MWQMYVFEPPGGPGLAVLVVDDECFPCYFGADPTEAATWLAMVGQRYVAITTAAGLEEFEVVKRDPATLPIHVLAWPQALLMPRTEATRPIRSTAEALAAVERFRRRRLGQAKRRHRRRGGLYQLLSADPDPPAPANLDASAPPEPPQT